MDDTFLRNQALNIASSRVAQDASVDALLAAADKIVGWLKTGEISAPADQPEHESVAAVAGQEPKGE